jgi:hypothetical protein
VDRRQKRTLWAGIVVFAGMGLYPPWVQEYHSPYLSDGSGPGRIQIGPTSGNYYWIFGHPPIPGWILKAWDESGDRGDILLGSARLDMPRLIVQWIVVGVFTGGLLWTLRKTEP